MDRVAACRNADGVEARAPACFYIQRCIAYNKNVRGCDPSAIFVGCFLCPSSNQFGPVFGIGTETAKSEVSIEVPPFELDSGARLDVSCRQSQHDVCSR